MEERECKIIKEKCYMQKLDNGLQVIIIPKKNLQKKYVICGAHFGSIDNEFIDKESGEKIKIPDGVAHFLEHKMFEQENGTDSLYTLMALGIDANAYTTNDHTAYLFECTDHFYEGLDELMDYLQNPYFTDKNVEKEKGIIGQEIQMYDDDPGWQLYMSAMDCLYENNPIKIDIAGTIESISKITPETLFKCYNNFYHPSNMVFVAVGDFEPNALLEEIKKRLKKSENRDEIQRIYPTEKEEINKKYEEKQMEVSTPIFMIGIKDKLPDKDIVKKHIGVEIILNMLIGKSSLPDKDIVKKHIGVEIILNMLIGKSSKLYSKLYSEGLLMGPPDMDYEFSSQYAHVLISGQSVDPNKVNEEILKEIQEMKQKEIDKQEFERIKKKIYGDYAIEYNNVSDIGRMFVADYVKGINSFEYMEKFDQIDENYIKDLLNNVFDENKAILAVVKGEAKK